MKTWVKEPFSIEFPSIDVMLMEVMRQADSMQLTLPPWPHSHQNCLKKVSGIVHTALTCDTELNEMDLVYGMMECQNHFNTLASYKPDDRTWPMIYERNIWNILHYGICAVMCASGNGFADGSDGNQVRIEMGKNGLARCIQNLMQSLLVLRMGNKHPDLLHGSSISPYEANKQRVLPPLVSPGGEEVQWLVEMLNTGWQEGAPKPSSLFPIVTG